MRVFGAVDLGASGGRVVAGIVADDRVMLDVVHRFPNGAAVRDGHLRWDFTGLFREVLTGLRALASAYPSVESIGIDTWAVDYGLLADGRLLAEPVCYRDDRTRAAVERVHERIPPESLYAINGLQFLPFNTVYQLAVDPLWTFADAVVLLPDLLAYWLTGELGTEITNASTTGLLDVRTKTWSADLLDVLGVPAGVLPPLEHPGQVRGRVLPEMVRDTGLPPATVVTTVGSHDTASAVVAIPAEHRRFAYISSGTWSLVGVELDQPVVTAAARAANFTNEGGVDGRTRFLRNVGGLWLLQECLRDWGLPLASVTAEAQALPSGGPVIDVDDPAFIPPGDMPARINQAAGGTLRSPAAITRCVLDSLATAYARTVDQAMRLSGAEIDTVHIVGGGSQNTLLCQLTADLTGKPVVTGPVEATALGNILVQARAHGAAPPSLEGMRAALAATPDLRTISPLWTCGRPVPG